MPDIALRLGRDMLVLEGAMGTLLQQTGLVGEGAPEALNLIAPDEITNIHRLYRLAGADCAITNTFGGSRPQLEAHSTAPVTADFLHEVNATAVRLARAAGSPHVLADISSTGLVLEPLGQAKFDEVYAAFLEQALSLASENPDAFLIETFTDIAEARCAVLACREAAPYLPVIASVSFGLSGRMELSGTDPATAAVILEAAGATALGMNCGLGPVEMEPLARAMLAAPTNRRLPVIVQPNAGLPCLHAQGHTHFPGTPTDFSTFARVMYDAGVAGIGSCCGSTPEFTAAIADEIADKPVQGHFRFVGQRNREFGEASVVPHVIESSLKIDAEMRNAGVSESEDYVRGTTVASPQHTVRIGGGAPLRAIGERINPTGKTRLKESLAAGSMTVVRELAAQQQQAGADLLDVNVGAAGIDEAETLPPAVQAVAGSFALPVSIDTTNPAALKAALKCYPGKALVNSVTGEEKSLTTVLPLVARYGAAVVVLALDDKGIPPTADARLEIVRRIRDRAREHGIPDENLLVDSLVMAAAADAKAPQVTLETTRRVHEELGLSTLLGVSNVSHGLPNRAALNAAFLTAAAANGLDAAIINPNDAVMAEAKTVINATRAANSPTPTASGNDPSVIFGQLLTEALQPAVTPTSATTIDPSAASTRPAADRLADAITLGDTDGAPTLVDEIITAGTAPTAVIADILTPAIQKLGEGFATGEVFLPQLMVAAEAMKAATAQAKTHLPPRDAAAQNRGTVVFATVKGDIHSIGKDICISLLESQSITVNDLGVDVPHECILDAAHSADAVCLSALMTTTLPAMEATVRALHERQPKLPICLGGAVVTRDWASAQGAYYTKDAPQLVTLLTSLLDSTAATATTATIDQNKDTRP